MSLADVVKILLTQKKTENPEDFVENVKGVLDGSIDLSSLGSGSESEQVDQPQSQPVNYSYIDTNPVSSDDEDRRSQDRFKNYYDSLKVSNDKSDKSGLSVPSLPGSNMFSGDNLPIGLQSDNFADIRADYFNKEYESGRALSPNFNAVDSNLFNQAQQDFNRAQMEQQPILQDDSTLPSASFDFDAFINAQNDFNKQQEVPLTLKPTSISLPDRDSVALSSADFAKAEAQSVPQPVSQDSNFDIGSLVSSFNDASRDFNNVENESQPVATDIRFPNLNFDNIEQAREDFIKTNQGSPVVKPDVNLPSINGFEQAREDFFNKQQDVANANLPNVDLSGIDRAVSNFNQAQRDFANRQPEGVAKSFNIPDISIDDFESAQRDYLERESDVPVPNVSDINIPSIDSINQAREDYASRENEPLKPVEFDLPSIESILDAREDYLDREQRQKVDSIKRPGLTTGEDLDKYNKFFDERGGLQDDYVTADKDILDSLLELSLLNNSVYDRGEMSGIDAYGDLTSGLDKFANENFDDGSMRKDAVKAKYMSLPVYKEYVKAGFGGRPLEELEQMDEGTVFNKLDEARDYGFRPYIEDVGQFASWMATQGADDITKAYNVIGNARDLVTDAKINYGDKQYSREDFYNNVGSYFENVNKLIDDGKVEMVDADDPSVDPESDMPMTVWWSFPGTDIEVASDDELRYQWSEDGSKLYCWLPGHEDQAVEYYGIEDYDANKPEWKMYRSEGDDPVHKYWKMPKLEYTQGDGTKVSLPYSSAEEIAQSMANGSADVDWGMFNIAKDNNDRKGFGDMITSGDFSDIVPNMVDLATGSAPLFTSPTAWPMAISNAATSTQGLDPRLWNNKNNTYYRLSDDMTGEKYLSNIALSGTVPATERIAGVIGGSGGLVGKPIQAGLKKIGAPAAARSAVDVLGEGAEESVASMWEDYQVNGLKNWFANPVYETDEFGNVVTEFNPATGKEEPKKKYDSSKHEVRDPNTSFGDRFSNWLDQQLDNVGAGAALGLAIGGPGIVRDAATGSGYYGESRERKLMRDFEKMHNLPRFREAKRENNYVRITPDDIGTYGKER